MKKDVLISITGLHYGDWNADGEEAEPIEVITPATYYLKNGKHYVIYDEIVEGMPGSIRNTVKITGDSMFEVTKKRSQRKQDGIREGQDEYDELPDTIR